MNPAWLLANWKLVAACSVFALLAIVGGTYRIQRDRARAATEVAKATIARLDAAGQQQARDTTRTNLEAAGITQRATDALVAQLADAHLRGDAVARRLREFAAARVGCTLPGVTVTPAGPVEAPGGASSPAAAPDPDVGYARACEADSTRLRGWQDWWRDQAAVR